MHTLRFLQNRKKHTFSEKFQKFFRKVPVILALMIGLGCIRALAALNRAGFVHRFVSPFNFAITNPLTKENIMEKIIIIDFSAVLPWPCK